MNIQSFCAFLCMGIALQAFLILILGGGPLTGIEVQARDIMLSHKCTKRVEAALHLNTRIPAGRQIALEKATHRTYSWNRVMDSVSFSASCQIDKDSGNIISFNASNNLLDYTA